jgi:hypothetical protein
MQITAAVFGQIIEAFGYVDAPLIQYAADTTRIDTSAFALELS